MYLRWMGGIRFFPGPFEGRIGQGTCANALAQNARCSACGRIESWAVGFLQRKKGTHGHVRAPRGGSA